MATNESDKKFENKLAALGVKAGESGHFATMLSRQLADLREANIQIKEGRRAALNLMEDAILSREALRVAEQRTRRQMEAFNAVINKLPLKNALNIIAQTVGEELEGATRSAFYILDSAGEFLHPVWGASTMPDGYLQAIDKFPVGEDSLACGLAIPTGKPVITSDVKTTQNGRRGFIWRVNMNFAPAGLSQ